MKIQPLTELTALFRLFDGRRLGIVSEIKYKQNVVHELIETGCRIMFEFRNWRLTALLTWNT